MAHNTKSSGQTGTGATLAMTGLFRQKAQRVSNHQ
jgi:hypothetical protein